MAAEMALTSTEFESEVSQSDVPVLIDFWAEWCGPCKSITPHIEQISKEYEGKAKVFKVDVDSESELAMRFGVMSIPTLLIFKSGEVVDRIVGAVPKEQIASGLDRAIG